MDEKTANALKEVGLPTDREGLRRLIGKGSRKDIRKKFVVVLERALGIVLEGKQSDIRQ